MKHKSSLAILLTIYCTGLSAIELDASLGWTDQRRYGFVVTGVVDDYRVDVGAKVKKGQLLARLDRRPFNYRVKHCQANIKQLEPKIYDARLALNHAEELFERTVLSEVELQRIDGEHKALVAQSEALKAECQLEKWRAEKSSLKARQPAYVISSTIVPGQIISDENQDEVYVELVSASRASATAWLSSDQKRQLKSSDRVEVNIDSRSIPAKLQSIELRANEQGQYRAVFVFDYNQPIEAGKRVRVSF